MLDDRSSAAPVFRIKIEELIHIWYVETVAVLTGLMSPVQKDQLCPILSFHLKDKRDV